jgi:hypothetical protein
MLSNTVSLNPITNEVELTYLYGESRETLLEQTFERFTDKVVAGDTITMTKTVVNGVVKVVFATVAPTP